MNRNRKRFSIRRIPCIGSSDSLRGTADNRLFAICNYGSLSGHRIRYPEKGLEGILNKQVFDENFLMAKKLQRSVPFCLASIRRRSRYAVLQIGGELFQSYAVERAARNISERWISADYRQISR